MKHLDPRVIRLIQDKVRLSRLHRWPIYLSLLLLTLSGLAWLLIELAVAQDLLDYQALRWQGLALKFHGAAAYLSLLGFGSVLARHVKRGWFLRRNRTSGSLLIATMMVLALTGPLTRADPSSVGLSLILRSRPRCHEQDPAVHLGMGGMPGIPWDHRITSRLAQMNRFHTAGMLEQEARLTGQ